MKTVVIIGAFLVCAFIILLLWGSALKDDWTTRTPRRRRK